MIVLRTQAMAERISLCDRERSSVLLMDRWWLLCLVHVYCLSGMMDNVMKIYRCHMGWVWVIGSGGDGWRKGGVVVGSRLTKAS